MCLIMYILWSFALFLYICFTKACVDDNSYYFDAATYIVTQSALNDAPNRYNAYVNDAEEYLNSMAWSRESAFTDCDNNYIIYGDQATKTISLNKESLLINITNNGFSIYSQFNVNFAVRVWYKQCANWLFGWELICSCDTICSGNDKIYGSGTVTVNTDITIDVNSVDGSISFNYTLIVDTNGISYNHNECDDASWITQQYIKWEDINIEQRIQEEVQKSVDNFTNELDTYIAVPQTYSPYQGVNVTYYISNVTIQASEYAKFEIKGLLAVTDTS